MPSKPRATMGGMQAPQPSVMPRRKPEIAPEPSEEAIRERAYEIYLRRGGGHGRDFDDWAQARQELMQEARMRQVA